MWNILKVLDWYEHFYLSFRIFKYTNFSVDVYVRLAVGGLIYWLVKFLGLWQVSKVR
jgi:hypothetical protein